MAITDLGKEKENDRSKKKKKPSFLGVTKDHGMDVTVAQERCLLRRAVPNGFTGVTDQDKSDTHEKEKTGPTVIYRPDIAK
jgi:hypothetical protein